MIKRIAIKNYKSLDVDFDLDPVTVLVGKSGTGKTNLVDAVRYLRKTLQEGSVTADSSIVSATAVQPDAISFQIEFEVDEVGTFSYLLILQLQGWLVQREELSLDGNTLFSVRDRLWVVRPRVRNLSPPAALVLGRLAGIREVSIAHTVLTRGLGCYDFPGFVCTKDGFAGTISEGLDNEANNYGSIFDAIKKNVPRLSDWTEINAALKCLNTSFEMVDIDTINSIRCLVVSHNVDGEKILFPIDQESEGLRRFLAHLLALYQSSPKQTLIFEEPEKGIHPGALATLAEEFMACPDQGRGQVLLTTHSPDLLDHVAPESIRVVEMENYVTRIGRPSKEQLKALRESLLLPGELLTVSPGRLDPVGRVGG